MSKLAVSLSLHHSWSVFQKSSKGQPHPTTNLKVDLGSLLAQFGTQEGCQHKRLLRPDDLSTTNDVDVQFLQSLPNILGESSSHGTQRTSPPPFP